MQYKKELSNSKSDKQETKKFTSFFFFFREGIFSCKKYIMSLMISVITRSSRPRKLHIMPFVWPAKYCFNILSRDRCIWGVTTFQSSGAGAELNSLMASHWLLVGERQLIWGQSVLRRWRDREVKWHWTRDQEVEGSNPCVGSDLSPLSLAFQDGRSALRSTPPDETTTKHKSPSATVSHVHDVKTPWQQKKKKKGCPGHNL